MVWYNARNLMLLCMLIFASILGYKFGASSLVQSIIGLSVAIILDFAIAYFKYGSKEFPVSGAISGLIAAMLFSPGSYVTVTAAASLAILSKHYVKYNGRHIFNPANFGIALVGITSLFIPLSASLTWQPAFVPGLLIILGFIVLYRLRRWEIHLTYFLTLAVLLLAQGLYNSLPQDRLIEFVYSGLTEGGLLFFVFFMVVEPVTSPATRKGRILYSFIIAVIGFALGFTPVIEYGLIFALALGNLMVPLLNKYTRKAAA